MDKDKITIIGIAGGTGSGKTTVVRKIVEALPPHFVAVVPLDSYYNDTTGMTDEERHAINFDHPDAFDWKLLHKQLNDLRNGKTIDTLNKCLQANHQLQAMGISQPDSAYSLIMPESYVGLPFMNVDPSEKEKCKKEKAAQQLKAICEDLRERKTGISHLTEGPLPWFFTHIVGGFFEHVLITDKRFHVVEERCVKCGICANVCPVGDISGGKGKKPVWLHHDDCLTCFSCYHHCPHHAIEFGRQTQKKGQYYYK